MEFKGLPLSKSESLLGSCPGSIRGSVDKVSPACALGMALVSTDCSSQALIDFSSCYNGLTIHFGEELEVLSYSFEASARHETMLMVRQFTIDGLLLR